MVCRGQKRMMALQGGYNHQPLSKIRRHFSVEHTHTHTHIDAHYKMAFLKQRHLLHLVTVHKERQAFGGVHKYGNMRFSVKWSCCCCLKEIKWSGSMTHTPWVGRLASHTIQRGLCPFDILWIVFLISKVPFYVTLSWQ